MNTKVEQYLIIAFTIMAVPLLLLLGRGGDDNRLTSWLWMFQGNEGGWLVVGAGLALAVAYLASACWWNHSPARAMVLALLAFAAGALFWPEPEVIVDSARYFTQAKLLSRNGVKYFFEEWGRGMFAWTDLPLIPFIYGILFKICGESRIVIQCFTSGIFAATVYVTCQLGSLYFDEETGFDAGVLLLGFPYLYTQIPLMLVDIPTMFLVVLAVYTASMGLRHGGTAWLAAAGSACFATMLVKYSAWLFLLVLIPVFLVTLATKKRMPVLGRGLLITMIVVVLIGLFLTQFHQVISSQLELLVSYQKPGMRRWGESYLSTFLYQTHPLLTAGALFSLVAAVRKKDPWYLVISFLVFLIIILQIQRIRYTLPVFPFLALMAAYGFRQITASRPRRFLVWGIALTSLAMAYFVYLPFLLGMGVQNLQLAGKFLDRLPLASAEVHLVMAEETVLDQRISIPLLDIYTGKNIVYPAWQTTTGVSAQFTESPLRFTWEFPMPDYYHPDKNDGAAIMVIISDRQNPDLPAAVREKIGMYSVVDQFDRSAGIFRYQTFVAVYHN